MENINNLPIPSSPTRKISSTRKKTFKRSLVPYTRLYNGLSGFGVNIQDNNTNLTYGELKEESIPILYEIFSKYAPLSKILPPYRNFYDLGCGIGKVIIGMAYKNASIKTIGIENVAERIVQANTALQRIRDDSVRKRIEFLCISMLDNSVNYSNACWIFISNLSMTIEVNEKLFEKLGNEVKSGCIIVCSKSHSNTKFEELNMVTLPMSWSITSKVYIYNKK